MPTPSKYFGTPKDPLGNSLQWPGTMDGFPVRAEKPAATTREEYERLQHQFDFHSEVLTLPTDKARYEEVKDRIANGLWLQSQEQIHFVPQDKTFIVFLSWIEPYGCPPPPGAADDREPGDR